MADPHQPEDDASGDDSDVGRPHPKGSLDPELVKLSRGPRAVGPVLALSVVVFCGYMMFQLRADLSFSRAGDSPTKFQNAAALVSGASAERFVALPLQSDRSLAVRIRKGQSKSGHRVTPVQGSNSMLWLVESGTPWSVQTAYHPIYTGRLRRLSDMPFHGALVGHLEKHPTAPTYVARDELRKALSTKAATVAHASGDALAVTGDTQVHVAETILDKVRIRAFRTERHPDAATWSKALVDAGIAETATPQSSDKDAFIYVVDAAAGIDDVKAKLAKAKLFMGRAEPVKRIHAGAWSTASATDAGLVLGGTTIPWRNVSAASLAVPRRVPDGAWVLVENEHPGAYWYLLPLYVVLALFSALFLWAFARGLRRGRPIPESSTSAAAPA